MTPGFTPVAYADLMLAISRIILFDSTMQSRAAVKNNGKQGWKDEH